jgi:hypothetical protein
MITNNIDCALMLCLLFFSCIYDMICAFGYFKFVTKKLCLEVTPCLAGSSSGLLGKTKLEWDLIFDLVLETENRWMKLESVSMLMRIRERT